MQQLAVNDEELSRKLFGRDLAIAHGVLGQLSHPLPPPAAHREDCFARLLHLLPVLLTTNPISDKMTARAVSDMIRKTAYSSDNCVSRNCTNNMFMMHRLTSHDGTSSCSNSAARKTVHGHVPLMVNFC